MKFAELVLRSIPLDVRENLIRGELFNYKYTDEEALDPVDKSNPIIIERKIENNKIHISVKFHHNTITSSSYIYRTHITLCDYLEKYYYCDMLSIDSNILNNALIKTLSSMDTNDPGYEEFKKIITKVQNEGVPDYAIRRILSSSYGLPKKEE